MIADNQPGQTDEYRCGYRLIDYFGPISRIEFSKLTQLAPASITKIVRELLQAPLIQETLFSRNGKLKLVISKWIPVVNNAIAATMAA